MADAVVLNKANPLSPAEDYNFLRREGIKHIEKLSGNIWTDYNTHDPGITLLEALCYAITDLTYRTKFEMNDLLAPANLNSNSWKNIFYTARQILPCNPVTLNDFRKIIIDIVGVRNAWITISKDCEVPVYINYINVEQSLAKWADANYILTEELKNDINLLPLCPGTHSVKTSLGFAPVGDKSKIIELNGLYKIIIEFEEDVIEKKHKEDVRQKVLHQLHRHRSLCEDYLSVTAAEYKNFNLATEVVLKEDADADMVLAQICFRIQKYFTPNHKFYSLEELLEKGNYAEDIFEGPFLKHGFILDSELEKTDFFRDMHLSDIINQVANIDGIIAISKFKVNDNLLPNDTTTTTDEPPFDKDDPCSNEQYFDEWIAGMKNDTLIGRLNIIDLAEQVNAADKKGIAPIKDYIAPVKLFKSGNRVIINADRFTKLLKDLKALDRNNKLQAHSIDFPVPTGENMELQDFYPVQYSLPQTYKVGEDGLPMKEGNSRLVQALQLKGYLAVFEQLFVNYLARLNNINQIFSFNEIQVTDFVTKIIDKDDSVPSGLKEKIAGYLHIYVDSKQYIDDVQHITESKTVFESRRNKTLDHLLARFSEHFLQYDLMMKYLYPKDYLTRVIKNKTDFLADYLCISNNRAKAYNYKLKEEGEDFPGDKDEELISHNISGLEQRICRLIGLADCTRKNIAPDNLFFEYTDPAKTKGKIRLYEDYEKKQLLLETVEIELKCQDTIMHCFIESGCCNDNFIKFPEHHTHARRKKHHNNEFSFILIDHNGKTLATSLSYTNVNERDTALEKTKKSIQLICHTEGLHIIEHILLRPKGDDAIEEDDKAGTVIKTVAYQLLDVCLDNCDLNINSDNPAVEILYKFDITVLPPKDCIDGKRWTIQLKKITGNMVIFQETFKEYEQAAAFISTIREYGSENINFKVFKNDDDTTLCFFRLFDENEKLIVESETCYKTGSSNVIFKKNKVSQDTKINPCNPAAGLDDVWKEINNLKAFLAFELDLYCCEDTCDNNEDPYSFRISFVLPCWPKRFRDKGFRRLVEQTIQSETPAHIQAKVYWLGVEQMRLYEDSYFEWIIEMAVNDVPDITIANDFITTIMQLKNCDEYCEDAATN